MTVFTQTTAPDRKAERATAPQETVVTLKRRTIDSVLIGFGAVAAAALLVAGGLLTWGSSFAADYVGDELSSQNIVFPEAAALQEDGRTDLLGYAGETLNTGQEAEAYASYIDGHLAAVAGGATYAELGGPEREAKAAVEAATAAGGDEATVTQLQGEADAITGQRNTLFKGETLRGLLLTAFAWSTVGRIAGIAAFAAFAAGLVMLVLVLLGMRHHHAIAVVES